MMEFGGVLEKRHCLLLHSSGVVVMTHAYGNCSGVRYMTGGLKVYYVPWRPLVMQNSLPTFYGTLPIIRTILIREKISLVHGHQAFSTLCHEALMHARTMGYKVAFTDHSLYGFADVGSIHMNKILQFTLADVNQAICVSHTSKENTVLRSGLPPEKVFVIPNAVDTAMFKPAPERLNCDEIIIVVISRLVYRKGADLLVEVIPEVCRLYSNVSYLDHMSDFWILVDLSKTIKAYYTCFLCLPWKWLSIKYNLSPSPPWIVGELHVYLQSAGAFLRWATTKKLLLSTILATPVRFIVGGDGPKRVRLEEMREKHSLQDRVEMLGAVPHAQVRSVLISGHIFLNSSLTEAFCIAILEAASCGLLTVSTRVLPDDMIILAEPDPNDMVQAIKKAIYILPKIDPQVMHLCMKKLYSWHDVARRTEVVYDRALKCSNENLLQRLSRYAFGNYTSS
ncbi:hypothetical protein HHK36_002235 [Tetracentron sinense]|uniref:PIGA GPI anchor biosynthesis domain-containing protein n=1 Tax=Tetracentron sinense TaxID=13715 RepID=A0A834ZYV3_TETSI|nr:hypothetical protein HHK36_002235 [Tetracentron sinense]